MARIRSKTGKCVCCHREGKLSKFQNMYVCDECLVPELPPLKLEDYMFANGSLSSAQNQAVKGMHGLIRAIERSLRKHGQILSLKQQKNMMFAEAKRHRQAEN